MWRVGIAALGTQYFVLGVGTQGCGHLLSALCSLLSDLHPLTPAI
jgi:hypothetical protein